MRPEEQQDRLAAQLAGLRNRPPEKVPVFEWRHGLSHQAQQVNVLLNAPIQRSLAVFFELSIEEVDRIRALPAFGPHRRLHLDRGAECGLEAHIVLELGLLQRCGGQFVGFRRVLEGLVELLAGERAAAQPGQRLERLGCRAVRRAVLVQQGLAGGEILLRRARPGRTGDCRADIPDNRARALREGDGNTQQHRRNQHSHAIRAAHMSSLVSGTIHPRA